MKTTVEIPDSLAGLDLNIFLADVELADKLRMWRVRLGQGACGTAMLGGKFGWEHLGVVSKFCVVMLKSATCMSNGNRIKSNHVLNRN